MANLFTQPDNIEWLEGVQWVRRYDVPGRDISAAFCTQCGSPVPYVSKSGRALIVPAGSLDSASRRPPDDHIFWAERASWYEAGVGADKFDGFAD